VATQPAMWYLADGQPALDPNHPLRAKPAEYGGRLKASFVCNAWIMRVVIALYYYGSTALYMEQARVIALYYYPLTRARRPISWQ